MPRVTIDLPKQFVFSTNTLLLPEHINLSGHLDNAKLLGLVSEARGEFWEFLGYEPINTEGLGNIVADVAAEYKSQAFLGETLIIELACNDYHKYGFDLAWRIRERSTQREVARGKHGMLCFDYQAQKVSILPDSLKSRLCHLKPID